MPLAACRDGERRDLRSIGFDNQKSDVVAVMLGRRQDEPAIVLMRAADSRRSRLLAFPFADGALATATEGANGRLAELAIAGHRFVFADYTQTQVTVTHTDPAGSVTTEQLSTAKTSGSAAVESPLHLAQQEERSLDEEVDDALRWIADPSNTFLPLLIYRRAGETVGKLWDRVRARYDQAKREGAELQMKVRNELTCLTESRATCARQTARQTPALMKELRVIDPDAETTAGLAVSDAGIRPKREEWDPLIRNGTISTEFSLTDVPCDESVFADMNPKCPQYVAPVPPQNGADAGAGADAGIRADGAAGPDRGVEAGAGVDASFDGGMGDGGTGVQADTMAPTPNCALSCTDRGCSETCGPISEHWRNEGGQWIFSRADRTGSSVPAQDPVTVCSKDLFLNTLDTKGARITYYTVRNCVYENSQLVRRESMVYEDHANTPIHPGDHSIGLISYLDGAATEMITRVECKANSVTRSSATRRGFQYTPGPSTTDMNREGCPTEESIRAFGKQAFPTVELTPGYIQSTNVYRSYLMRQPSP